MAKRLPRGIRENKGTYEARAMINGIKITLYGSDLNALIEEFTEAKEKAKSSQDYRKNRITLNEWFEECFSTVKAHRVKAVSYTHLDVYKRQIYNAALVLGYHHNPH